MGRAVRTERSTEQPGASLQRPASGITPSSSGSGSVRAKKPLGLRAPLTPFAPAMEPPPVPKKAPPPSSGRAAVAPAAVMKLEAVPPPPPAIAAFADMPVGDPAGFAPIMLAPQAPQPSGSGVRLAGPSNDAVPDSAPAPIGTAVRHERDTVDTTSDDELHPPLSFQVYSLEELDRRRPDADPSLRMSRVMFGTTPRPPSVWKTVGERASTFAQAFAEWARAWARTPKQRPATEPMRIPFELAREALFLALRTVNWRRASFYGGASLATLVVLFGVVLTVADLTDDMKPRSARDPDGRSTLATPDIATVRATGSTTTIGTRTTSALTAPIANAAANVVEIAGTNVNVGAPTAAPSIELDDSTPISPPTVAARTTTMKPRHAAPLGNTGARPKTKLGYRDPNEIWKP
jgi:hypothetical protein